MTTISIVVHSVHGHTRVIAEAVARGVGSVESVQASVIDLRAEEVQSGRWTNAHTMELLEASDGIIFGAPTLMGSVSAVMKAFMETAYYPWSEQRWKDKFGSAFTNSASQSGDKLNSLIQFAVFGAQMGLIWIPVGYPPGNNWSGGTPSERNRLGSWLGLMSQSNRDQGPDLSPSDGDRRTAEEHGARFAQIVRHWKSAGDYPTERIVEGRKESRK